jgi:hypothetical protein
MKPSWNSHRGTAIVEQPSWNSRRGTAAMEWVPFGNRSAEAEYFLDERNEEVRHYGQTLNTLQGLFTPCNECSRLSSLPNQMKGFNAQITLKNTG